MPDKVEITFKVINPNDKQASETRKADVDTSLRVEEVLGALQKKLGLPKNASYEVYLSVDLNESLASLGVKSGDSIVIMPRKVEDLIEFK